ncbi:MAG: glutathione-disulfide reductase [Pseudomonadota bacterium]|nr:glutathione-disulfide reductase [Pseudomonadota bacterium]
MSDFDLFVVGAGSGGVRAARMAAAAGARVAVAEERYMGGTCVNVGCIPKKLYSYAAHYRYDFEDSVGFGWQLSKDPQFDWAALRDAKQHEIARLNGIYQNLLDKCGATVMHGRARLCNPHTVEVDGKRFTAKYILIATGGWPFVPEFPGREHVVTSNEIFDLPAFPRRILIAGAGYIAVEFAGIFAGLGAQALLSYRGEILKDFDPDLRERFAREAAKHVRLLPKTLVAAVEKRASGLLVSMQDGAQHEVDCVLFATGRRPNVANLGLGNTRVELTPDGTIKVDSSLRTTEPSIYALGDVVGRLTLTPVALAEGMMLADHLFGDGKRAVSYDNVATAIFSHPNIATVGLSEPDAAEQYPELAIFESDFRALRHTLSGRDERTYMKVVVDSASDRVVGMHMMGPDAGEVIQGFAAAMNCGLTKAQLDGTLGIHPTMAEEFVTMRTPARTVSKKAD